MKKLSISILVAFILSNIFFNIYTSAVNNSNLTPSIVEDKSLTSFDLETLELNTYHLPESMLKNPDTTPLQSYVPENLLSSSQLMDSSVSTNKVIGDDSREQIINTSILPYSCIGLIEVTFPDGFVGGGTAFLVAKNVAVTAGHCLYDKKHGLAQSLKFFPGMKGFGSNSKPFGIAYGSRTIVPDEWLNNQNEDYDWGIFVTQSNIGEQCGWMSIGTYPNPETCKGLSATISGYPGPNQPGTIYGWQYKSTGIIDKSSEYRLGYQIDMTGGQSGSPIYNSDNMVFGVNVREYYVQPKNEGSRVTLFFLTTIRDVVVKYS